MTVSTNVNKVSYSGDGATVAFDLGAGFIFFEDSELNVFLRVDATGVSTLQTITTEYSVTGGSGLTGTVTMVTAPAVGETLTIQRVMPLTQTSDLVNNDTQDAEVVEDMIDKNTLGLQQLDEAFDRTLKSPVDETASMEIPPAVERRGKFAFYADDASAQPTATTAVDAAVPLNDLLEAMRQSTDTPAADKLPYLNGVNDATITDFTAFARTILDDANGGAVLTTLGVSAFAQTVLDDADAEESRTTLEVTTADTGSLILPVGSTGQRDGSPLQGYVRANSDVSEVEWYNGTGWATLGGTPDVMTTQGDMIRGAVSGSAERLALGTEGEVLRASASDAEWTAAVAAASTQVTTSGTAFDFTAIPSWVSRVTVMLQGVSLSGSDNLLIQLGDAGGFETSSYEALGAFVSSTGQAHVTSTAGLVVFGSAAGGVIHAAMTIANINGNTWVANHSGTEFVTTRAVVGGGFKTLSDTLTQVRLTRTGTDTFDAGQVNILYE